MPSLRSKLKIFLITAENWWKIEIKVFPYCAIWRLSYVSFQWFHATHRNYPKFWLMLPTNPHTHTTHARHPRYLTVSQNLCKTPIQCFNYNGNRPQLFPSKIFKIWENVLDDCFQSYFNRQITELERLAI